MSGAGNDFVVVDNRSGIIPDPEQFAVKVCHRRYGIGADGLLLVEKSSRADFTMKYYNADGSYGGMCGNGGRCIAKYAFDEGIVQTKVFSFDALEYVYTATQHAPNVYELKMKNPQDFRARQTVAIDDQKVYVHSVDTGAPHCVIFLDENPGLGKIENLDVYGIGRKIRYHKLYEPKGTNVNFVSVNTDKSIVIRTYERGVEDETLACGTGSIASSLISASRYSWSKPVTVNVKSGELLEVGFQKNGNEFTEIRLKGNAQITFRGIIEL